MSIRNFQDIKRIFLVETLRLLARHNLLEPDKANDLVKTLQKPDSEIMELIGKLDSDRSEQVEFLWIIVDELEKATHIGFSDAAINDSLRSKCFTGLGLLTLDEIYNSYLLRSPENSDFYMGLQRVIGFLPENTSEIKKKAGTLKEEALKVETPEEWPPSVKAGLFGRAIQFFSVYFYEDGSHLYKRNKQDTPFAHLKKLDIKRRLDDLRSMGNKYQTATEAAAEANSAKREKEVTATREAREKAAKAKPNEGKGHIFAFGVFGNNLTSTATSAQDKKQTHSDADEKSESSCPIATID